MHFLLIYSIDYLIFRIGYNVNKMFFNICVSSSEAKPQAPTTSAHGEKNYGSHYSANLS